MSWEHCWALRKHHETRHTCSVSSRRVSSQTRCYKKFPFSGTTNGLPSPIYRFAENTQKYILHLGNKPNRIIKVVKSLFFKLVTILSKQLTFCQVRKFYKFIDEAIWQVLESWLLRIFPFWRMCTGQPGLLARLPEPHQKLGAAMAGGPELLCKWGYCASNIRQKSWSYCHMWLNTVSLTQHPVHLNYKSLCHTFGTQILGPALFFSFIATCHEWTTHTGHL